MATPLQNLPLVCRACVILLANMNVSIVQTGERLSVFIS